MNKEDFEKEKERRDKEDSVFKCPCGAIVIGRNRDYDEHLKNKCPLYKLAKEKLNE